MVTLMNEMNSQMPDLPQAVQIWVNWLMFTFFATLAFVRKHKTARIVLGTMLLTMPLALGIYAMTHTVHLIAAIHLLLWTPLLAYIYKVEFKGKEAPPTGFYGKWLIIFVITISISLLFDVRDIYLVLMGLK